MVHLSSLSTFDTEEKEKTPKKTNKQTRKYNEIIQNQASHFVHSSTISTSIRQMSPPATLA